MATIRRNLELEAVIDPKTATDCRAATAALHTAHERIAHLRNVLKIDDARLVPTGYADRLRALG
jgi:hypothetical protein